jgi:hypothetical protein
MVGTGMGGGVPGSLQGVQICVGDIEAAHAELVEHGVDATPVRDMGASGWEAGPDGDYNSFIFFLDPDGNSWAVQESPILKAELAGTSAAGVS